MIKLLLLLSLSFNIAHATIISIADDCTECHNNTLCDYAYETNVVADSADLCTMHHFFHFLAIINVFDTHFDAFEYSEESTQKNTFYSPPPKETSIKPPYCLTALPHHSDVLPKIQTGSPKNYAAV